MKHLFTTLSACLLFATASHSAQTNIASKATCSTSYVSSWETLTAINDGYEPASSADDSHGAYGNWQSGVTNTWNWVQYTFSEFYTISRSDVYWWADGSGIVLPYQCKMTYYHPGLKVWKDIPNPVGLGVEADQYNSTTFDTILTNQIRLYFVSTVAQGILEWKVYGEQGEQIPTGSWSYIATLAKNDTTAINIISRTSGYKIVPAYQFKVDAIITNTVSQDTEVYVVNGLPLTETTRNILLPPTDSTSGKISFDVVLPASIDPTDGVEIVVKYNEGRTALRSYSYYETGLTPPTLTADTSLNTIDNPVELTFTDDSTWRAAINRVLVGTTILDTSYYELLPGKFILTPAAGNPLTSAGSKTIYIEATGYVKAQVSQTIKAGAIDTLASTVSSDLKLFKNATITYTVQAKDRFGNTLSGVNLWWDGIVANTAGSFSETYTVEDSSFITSIYGLPLTATDASGETTFTVSIPATVNTGDGLTIRVRTADNLYLNTVANYTCLSTEKHIYVDSKLKTYEWSYSKSAQSDNFIIFWGNLIGTDPQNPANGSSSLKIDPVDILEKLEGYLALNVDTFGFITNKTSGNMAYYKFPIIITDSWDNSGYSGGYANGGSTDGVIGSMWVHPSATSGTGFVLAHEFTHMCQAMIPIQYSGKGISDPSDGSYNLGMFWESHANFMGFTATGDISAANPQRFVNTAMLHFSSTSHYYENNYFLQYLYDHYGMEVINKIWRNATQGMHPLTCLRSNQIWSQAMLNNEFGYYAMHNVNWDYTIHDNINRVLKSQGDAVVCRQYTIVDTCAFNPGWYIVPKHMAPADYGYNIIPIYPETNATQVSVQFYGYANAAAGGAGWRYGFVAIDENGTSRYSDLYSTASGEATFDISTSDSLLYFVVTGAPTTHHNYVWTPGWPKVYRYPYRFSMTGAKPAGHSEGYNNQHETYSGSAHANGGGWVSSTATVAATAYVGSNAQVLEDATVSGNARIEDYAVVKGNATVSGNAVVKGTAMVGSTAKVRENAVVDQSARVFYTSDIYGNAHVTGSAIVYSSTVYGSAIIKDLAWLDGATVYGTAIIGGDAEDFETISAGTYLQDYGLRDGDGLTTHYLNNDINPSIDEYTAIPSIRTNETLCSYYITDDQLYINSEKTVDITIYDLSGVPVCHFSLTGNYTLPTSQVGKSGIYLMNVISGDEKQTYKLVIGNN